MAAMPKLNMGAVEKDKEKKTLKESMRQLSRKASASLKRGLTPRGSRVDRQASFDSLDEASRQEEALTGALGPQQSAVSASDTESDAVAASSAADSSAAAAAAAGTPPPLVDPPLAEHERLPQFQPTDSAAKDVPADLDPAHSDQPPLGAAEAETPPKPQAPPQPASAQPARSLDRVSASKPPLPRPRSSEKLSAGLALDAVSSPAGVAERKADNALDSAPAGNGTDKEDEQGDPAPLVQPPLAEHEKLPQFEPAGEIAAAAKEEAALPADSGADGKSACEPPKWLKVVVAVGIFAVGIVAAEPALEAWRRRHPAPPPPVVDAKAVKKRGGWGFA